MVAYDAGLLSDPSDAVHHRNHDRQDNRLDNLTVMSHREHSRKHKAERRLDWERARRLYEQNGLSTIAVAREMGTHPGNVSRRLREMGVIMRRIGVHY